MKHTILILTLPAVLLLFVLFRDTTPQEMPAEHDHSAVDTMSGMNMTSADEVLLTDASMRQIGVQTSPVRIAPLMRQVRSTGRFVMDEQAERAITMKMAGYIENLQADFDGKEVQAGDLLFELYSPELLATQEEWLGAVERARSMSGPGADDAKRIADASRRRLELWDIAPSTLDRIEASGKAARTLPVFAPSSGEIMRKDVSEGSHVRAGQHLMDIVDITKTWLIVDVHEQDLPWVGIGTKAHIELPYEPGMSFEGHVDYIYHMLDENLRAARARIVLRGGHHAPFKPGMFATVYLEGDATDPGPVVPLEALIRDGKRELVIEALGGGRFRPVPVRSGRESGGVIQILEGLHGHEDIVTNAQFLIDSEARLSSVVMSMSHDH